MARGRAAGGVRAPPIKERIYFMRVGLCAMFKETSRSLIVFLNSTDWSLNYISPYCSRHIFLFKGSFKRKKIEKSCVFKLTERTQIDRSRLRICRRMKLIWDIFLLNRSGVIKKNKISSLTKNANHIYNGKNWAFTSIISGIICISAKIYMLTLASSCTGCKLQSKAEWRISAQTQWKVENNFICTFLRRGLFG